MTDIPQRKKIIVKIFSSFMSSQQAKKATEDFCDVTNLPFYGQGEDKEIYITSGEDYTHVIIWNTAMPWIHSIPKENVVGFAHEPFYFLNPSWTFIEYAKEHIGTYYIGDVKWTDFVLPEVFQEGYGYLGHNPLNYSILYHSKKKRMSLVLSNKYSAPGHIYRHELCKAILKTDLPIDIYGRGCNLYSKGGDYRVKGTFELNEPYTDYEFSICIENYQSNHYFSEKIVNPILCETTPIYLGCYNIESYFPNGYVYLYGELEKDIALLQDICLYPEKYRKKTDPVKVSLETTNLITFLHKRYY
jgi:hypothetical protein